MIDRSKLPNRFEYVVTAGARARQTEFMNVHPPCVHAKT